MNKTLAVVVACIASTTVFGAFAQGRPAAPAAGAAAPAPPPPEPPPELDEAFEYFRANWKCETRIPAGTFGPGTPEVVAKSKLSFKKVEKGWYYEGLYTLKKTTATPDLNATFLISYQPLAGVFSVLGYDDMGGALSETSSGFVGDTITFVGEGFMLGQAVQVRETMTRVPEDGMVHTHEVDFGGGFQLVNEDACTR
jgi:hypothetical protein